MREQSAAVEPALVSARVCAELVSIAEDVWRRWDAGGLTPAAVVRRRPGGPGVTRWAIADVRLWIELGCPRRREFEARKGVKR